MARDLKKALRIRGSLGWEIEGISFSLLFVVVVLSPFSTDTQNLMAPHSEAEPPREAGRLWGQRRVGKCSRVESAVRRPPERLCWGHPARAPPGMGLLLGRPRRRTAVMTAGSS